MILRRYHLVTNWKCFYFLFSLHNVVPCFVTSAHTRWTRKMLFGEPKGPPKCLKKTTGIAAFVHIGITRKPSSAPCATSEKVNSFNFIPIYRVRYIWVDALTHLSRTPVQGTMWLLLYINTYLHIIESICCNKGIYNEMQLIGNNLRLSGYWFLCQGCCWIKLLVLSVFVNFYIENTVNLSH